MSSLKGSQNDGTTGSARISSELPRYFSVPIDGFLPTAQDNLLACLNKLQADAEMVNETMRDLLLMAATTDAGAPVSVLERIKVIMAELVKNAKAIAALAPDAPQTPTITPIVGVSDAPTPAVPDEISGDSSTGDGTHSPCQGATNPPIATEIPSATTPPTKATAMDPSPPSATKRARAEPATPNKRRKTSSPFPTEPPEFPLPAPSTVKRRLSCLADEDERPFLSTLKRFKSAHRAGFDSPVVIGKKRGLDESEDGDASTCYRNDFGLKRPRNEYFQPGDPPMEYETWSDDEEEEREVDAGGEAEEEKHGNRGETKEV